MNKPITSPVAHGSVPFPRPAAVLLLFVLSAARQLSPVAHGSAVVLPRLAAVGFEPRSRGFCGPLPGQPFYGWLGMHHYPRWFAPALGRLRRPSGAWGGITTGRPWRPASSPIQSHHFQKLISLIPSHLPHLTPSNLTTPPYPGIGASCSHERNSNHAYTCTN